MASTVAHHHHHENSLSGFVDEASHQHSDATTPSAAFLAQHLTLRSMQPVQRTSTGAALRRLMDVEWVEVVGAARDPMDGKMYYEVHVYTREPVSSLHRRNGSRLPALVKQFEAMERPSHREPNHRVRRRFSDFNRLRRGILCVVQHPHGHYCDLCNEFQSLLLFSSTRSAMVAHALLPSVAFRTKVLDKFVREVVAQFQSSQDALTRQPKCLAAHEMPMALRAFLFW